MLYLTLLSSLQDTLSAPERPFHQEVKLIQRKTQGFNIEHRENSMHLLTAMTLQQLTQILHMTGCFIATTKWTMNTNLSQTQMKASLTATVFPTPHSNINGNIKILTTAPIVHCQLFTTYRHCNRQPVILVSSIGKGTLLKNGDHLLDDHWRPLQLVNMHFMT